MPQWHSAKANVVELIHGFTRSEDQRSCEPAAYPSAIVLMPRVNLKKAGSPRFRFKIIPRRVIPVS